MQPLTIKPGDLITQKDQSAWSAIKILAVDRWPDGSAAAHCLLYKTASERPTVESLKQAKVQIWHAPIDASSFNDWELVGNQAPSENECCGFIEYLKSTDFARYVSFTGKDFSAIIGKANEHYQQGNALCEQGKRVEAIAAYRQRCGSVSALL